MGSWERFKTTYTSPAARGPCDLARMPDQPFSCPFCGRGDFLLVRRVSFALQHSDLANPWDGSEFTSMGNREANFRGGMNVCTGCGRVELFMEEPERWAQAAAACGARVAHK